MPLPNLFIPGGPKCGTSSLAAWLSEHPDAFISKPKEACYFSHDYKHLTPVNTLEAYQKLYQIAENHKIIGEATPFYLASKAAIPQIVDYTPDAKFIVCLRDPVAMAQSMHFHWLRAGYEAVQDFETAWTLIQKRRTGHYIPISCPDAKMLDYDYTCSMGAQIQRLLEHIPRKHVHFVLLDDWRNPRPTWLNILDFLGLKDDERKHFPIKNKGGHARWPQLARLMSTAAKTRYRLGMKQGFGIMNRVAQLNEVKSKASPLPPRFASHLRQHFADDIQLLAQLSGRDLSAWMTTDAA